MRAWWLIGVRIQVNVAWPYANGALHVGHVAGSLLGPDIFSRFQRMNGHDVAMVSGSDQHGTAVSISAEREGVKPEVLAEKYHRINKDSIEWLGIQFDIFTKTHSENHFEVSRSFFLDLYGKGYLYPKTTEQYYCSVDRRFLADTFVAGTCPKCGNTEAKGNQCEICKTIFEPGDLISPRCTICSNPTTMKESSQLFFALSKFSDQLRSYLSSKRGWRQNVLDFSLNWINSGLEDRSATRDLDWGIPVPLPGYEGKVIYVWMEAVIGYLSASIELSRLSGGKKDWKHFWEDPDTVHYYFMGKDNIPFHTIIWPAMLLARGNLVLPSFVVANEYLTPGDSGLKFSKSRGGAPEIRELAKKLSPEHLRYYLTAVMPETRDSAFSLEDLVAKVNNELVATLGNYYHRVLSFSYKNFRQVHRSGSSVPDASLMEEMEKTASDVSSLIGSCEFKKALRAVTDLAQKGNQFFDRCAPWSTLKSDRSKCETDLFSNLELVRRIAIMSFPFLPFSSERIIQYLGLSPEEEIRWQKIDSTPEFFNLSEPAPVFRKLDMEELGREEVKEVSKDAIPLDIRVGLITSVTKHPSADKLYLLEVDIGEKRQIIAGLRAHYSEGELLGRRVVVLANLATARLRGYESQGMILAAENGDRVRLLKPPPGLPPGPVSGEPVTKRTITIDEFRSLDLRIACRQGDEFSIGADCPEDAMEVAARIVSGSVIPLGGRNRLITVDGDKIGVGSRIK
jgi:methionyl-tRNA synthetase